MKVIKYLNNLKTLIKKRFKEGLSLTETLIWAGIVSIFIGTVVVSSAVIFANTKKKAAKQEIRAIASALITYYSAEGSFPSDDEGLEALIKKSYFTDKDLIKDPWENDYSYIVMNDGEGFKLTSMGPDKKLDTEDDISYKEGLSAEEDLLDDI